LKYFGKVQKFHLVAHSYGSYLALKIAEKLESIGKTGHITFIDGAPLFIKTLAVEHYKVTTDEELQNSVIAQIFATVFTNLEEDYVKEVFNQPTWQDKVNKVVEFNTVQKVYGTEYLKLMLNAMVNRIKIILSSDTKISSIKKCSATLLRPNTASVANINETYDLDENFKNKVDVIYLDGTHFSILENPKLIEELNSLHNQLEN
jgi:fatty acid synthase, animal type